MTTTDLMKLMDNQVAPDDDIKTASFTATETGFKYMIVLEDGDELSGHAVTA